MGAAGSAGDFPQRSGWPVLPHFYTATSTSTFTSTLAHPPPLCPRREGAPEGARQHQHQHQHQHPPTPITAHTHRSAPSTQHSNTHSAPIPHYRQRYCKAVGSGNWATGKSARASVLSPIECETAIAHHSRCRPHDLILHRDCTGTLHRKCPQRCFRGTFLHPFLCGRRPACRMPRY